MGDAFVSTLNQSSQQEGMQKIKHRIFQTESASFIYWINLFWTFLILNSVLTPFYLKHGMTFQQIGLVSTVFNSVLLLSDIPMGLIADQIGVKKSLMIAGFLKGSGGIILFFGHQFQHFIFAFVVIGLANAMYSGCDIKLLIQESSKKVKDPKNLKNQSQDSFRKRMIYAQLGTAASSILGSIFVKDNDFTVPMMLNAICAWIPFSLSLFLQDLPKHFNSSSGYKQGVLEAWADLKTHLTQSAHFRLAFLSRVLFTVIVTVHVAYLQGFLSMMKINVKFFGIISFYNSVLAILGSYYSHKMFKNKSISAEALIFALPLISLGAVVASPILGNYSLVLLCAIELSRGLGPVLFVSLFNQDLPLRSMTAINSVCTTTSSLVTVVLLPFVGRALDKYGFQLSYLMIFLISFPIILFLVVGFAQQRKKHAVL